MYKVPLIILAEIDKYFSVQKTNKKCSKTEVVSLHKYFKPFWACWNGFWNFQKIVNFGQNSKRYSFNVLAEIGEYFSHKKTNQKYSKTKEISPNEYLKAFGAYLDSF